MPACLLDNFWSEWYLDTAMERQAVYLMASCWLYKGEEGPGDSLLAEDPLPPQKVHITTQGDLTSLF